MLEWQTVVAFGALVLSVLSSLTRMLDKSLSIREHEEFRRNIREQFGILRDQIKVLEQSRPTNGELGAVATMMEKRLDAISRMITKSEGQTPSA